MPEARGAPRRRHDRRRTRPSGARSCPGRQGAVGKRPNRDSWARRRLRRKGPTKVPQLIPRRGRHSAIYTERDGPEGDALAEPDIRRGLEARRRARLRWRPLRGLLVVRLRGLVADYDVDLGSAGDLTPSARRRGPPTPPRASVQPCRGSERAGQRPACDGSEVAPALAQTGSASRPLRELGPPRRAGAIAGPNLASPTEPRRS